MHLIIFPFVQELQTIEEMPGNSNVHASWETSTKIELVQNCMAVCWFMQFGELPCFMRIQTFYLRFFSHVILGSRKGIIKQNTHERSGVFRFTHS